MGALSPLGNTSAFIDWRLFVAGANRLLADAEIFWFSPSVGWSVFHLIASKKPVCHVECCSVTLG